MGGNVIIDGKSADRLDITKHNRTEIVEKLSVLFKELNKIFFEKNGVAIWKDSVINSTKFLSGSTVHLFDKTIDNRELAKVKPTFGDIDLKVDSNISNHLAEFLKELTSKKVGDFVLIGVQNSGTQYITLWKSKFGNVQVDFELVDFHNGSPTDYSSFSRSSPFSDLKVGVKGVFHKYLMRALTAKFLVHGVIKAKTSRGKDKVTLHPTVSFSVDHGLRTKLVRDGEENGLPILKENPDSLYTKDLNEIFEVMFGVKPSQSDIQKFHSFTGTLELIKKYVKTSKDIDGIALGFAITLWSTRPKAQMLYRDDPTKDQVEKLTAFNYLLDALGINEPREILDMRTKYYAS